MVTLEFVNIEDFVSVRERNSWKRLKHEQAVEIHLHTNLSQAREMSQSFSTMIKLLFGATIPAWKKWRNEHGHRRRKHHDSKTWILRRGACLCLVTPGWLKQHQARLLYRNTPIWIKKWVYRNIFHFSLGFQFVSSCGQRNNRNWPQHEINIILHKACWKLELWIRNVELTVRLSLAECEALTQREIIVPRGVILGYCFSHWSLCLRSALTVIQQSKWGVSCPDLSRGTSVSNRNCYVY